MLRKGTGTLYIRSGPYTSAPAHIHPLPPLYICFRPYTSTQPLYIHSSPYTSTPAPIHPLGAPWPEDTGPFTSRSSGASDMLFVKCTCRALSPDSGLLHRGLNSAV